MTGGNKLMKVRSNGYDFDTSILKICNCYDFDTS